MEQVMQEGMQGTDHVARGIGAVAGAVVGSVDTGAALVGVGFDVVPFVLAAVVFAVPFDPEVAVVPAAAGAALGVKPSWLSALKTLSIIADMRPPCWLPWPCPETFCASSPSPS